MHIATSNRKDVVLPDERHDSSDKSHKPKPRMSRMRGSTFTAGRQKREGFATVVERIASAKRNAAVAAAERRDEDAASTSSSTSLSA